MPEGKPKKPPKPETNRTPLQVLPVIGVAFRTESGCPTIDLVWSRDLNPDWFKGGGPKTNAAELLNWCDRCCEVESGYLTTHPCGFGATKDAPILPVLGVGTKCTVTTFRLLLWIATRRQVKAKQLKTISSITKPSDRTSWPAFISEMRRADVNASAYSEIKRTNEYELLHKERAKLVWMPNGNFPSRLDPDIIKKIGKGGASYEWGGAEVDLPPGDYAKFVTDFGLPPPVPCRSYHFHKVKIQLKKVKVSKQSSAEYVPNDSDEPAMLEGNSVKRVLLAQGHSPPPNNLPNLPPYAVTRRAKLAEISREFRENPLVCIVGLPGTGKTLIAVDYARKARSRYPGGVWWVNANSGPITALARLESDLRLHGPPEMQQVLKRVEHTYDSFARANAVRSCLESIPVPSLVVLDDVNCDWSMHTPRGNCRILETTTNARHSLARAGDPIICKGFTLNQARRLCNRLAPATTPSEEASRDLTIDGCLGLFPLAVLMAASAVSRNRLNTTWDAYKSELLSNPDFINKHPTPDDYPRNVGSAIDVSLDQCLRNPDSSRLLIGLAALPLSQVPFEWIVIASNMPSELEVRNALLLPWDLHIVERFGDIHHEYVAVHSLVHRRLRDRITEKFRTEWCDARERFMSHLASHGTGAYFELREALPSLLESAKALRMEEEWLGIFEHAIDPRFSASAEVEVCRQAVQIAERLYGKADPRLVKYLQRLGSSLISVHEHEATEVLRRALQICQDAPKQDHELLADIHERLGSAYLTAHSLPDAQQHYRSALSERVSSTSEVKNTHILETLFDIALKRGHLKDYGALLDRIETVRSNDWRALHGKAEMIAKIDSEHARIIFTRVRAMIQQQIASAEPGTDPDGYHRRLAELKVSLAAVFHALGDDTESRTTILEARDHCDMSGDAFEVLVPTRSSIAVMMCDIGLHDDASSELLRIQHYCDERGQIYGTRLVLNRVRALLKLNRREEALALIPAALKACELLLEVGLINHVADLMATLPADDDACFHVKIHIGKLLCSAANEAGYDAAVGVGLFLQALPLYRSGNTELADQITELTDTLGGGDVESQLRKHLWRAAAHVCAKRRQDAIGQLKLLFLDIASRLLDGTLSDDARDELDGLLVELCVTHEDERKFYLECVCEARKAPMAPTK